MKEILFELNDGQIVGLSMMGLVAVWLLLTSLVTAGGVYSLTKSGDMYDDPIGATFIALLVSAGLSGLAMLAIYYWRFSVILLGIVFLLLSPSALAYWLGSLRR